MGDSESGSPTVNKPLTAGTGPPEIWMEMFDNDTVAASKTKEPVTEPPPAKVTLDSVQEIGMAIVGLEHMPTKMSRPNRCNEARHCSPPFSMKIAS